MYRNTQCSKYTGSWFILILWCRNWLKLKIMNHTEILQIADKEIGHPKVFSCEYQNLLIVFKLFLTQVFWYEAVNIYFHILKYTG